MAHFSLMAIRAGHVYSTITSSLLEVARHTAIRSAVFRDFLLLASSTALYQASRFVVSFIAAGVLGPATFGLWQTLYLISIYGGGVNLGIINAMEREVPFFKGKGDFQRVGEVRRTSLAFVVLGTPALGVLIIIAALFVESSLQIPLILAAILFVCFQFYAYLRDYLKSDRRFNLMSCQQLTVAVMLLAVAIPLTLGVGLPGFIVGQSVSFLCASIVVVIFVSFGFRLSYDWREIKRLIRIGFPIMCGGYIYILLTTGDRLIIMGFLGTEQLGLYSLVIMLTSSLSVISSAVSQVIYPRMAETFGRTGDRSSLKSLVVQQFGMTLGIALPALVCIDLLFPALVEKFLPSYVPGLTAVRIVLPAFLFFLCVEGIVNFLYVINRQVYVLFLQIIAFVLNIALSLVFVAIGWGINGVALATALGYVGYVAAFSTIAWRLLKERRYGQSVLVA